MRTIARTLLLLAAAALAACDGDPTGAGPPAQLQVVSGNDQQGTVGQELPQPLVVQVLDDDGRPVRGQLVNFVVTRGGGAVFAGSALTNREGIAQERWTLGTAADSQRVEARAVDSETGAAVVFATFRAVARAGSAAGIAAVQAQVSGQPGTALADSVAAVVRDQHGNPVPGAMVTWTVTGGGGSVSPGASTTSAQGVARARWVLGANLSKQTLQASAGASMTATFTATPALGAGAALSAVSGDNQTGAVGSQLAAPLVVEVRQGGVPVQGVPIQWSTSDGTLSGATATDAQGRASAQWTLGTATGTRVALAQVPGAGLTVGFTATTTAGAPGRVVAPGLPPGYSARAGEEVRLEFSVVNGYGNRVPGATLHFSSSAGGSVNPATVTTNAEGFGYAFWTVPTTAGTQGVLTASSPGVPGTASVQVPIRPGPSVAVRITPDVATAAPNVQTGFSAYVEDAYGNPTRARGIACDARWSTSPQAGLMYGAASWAPDVWIWSSVSTTVTVRCEDLGLSDTAELIVQ